MKYYSLKHEFLKAGSGSYPQSEGMTDNYPYNREDSVWNINYDTELVPNLDAIRLVQGAKLLDMLSSVVISEMIGKIVSENFKELLHNFRLPAHRFFEAKVINCRKREIREQQYYLFRVLEHQNQYIDFDKSEFYVHRRGVGEVNTINIGTANDLEKTPEEQGLGIGQYIKPKFITLFPEVDYDIFSFRRFAGFFVSERLKTAVENQGLTGIKFEPADFILQQELTLSKFKNV